MTKMKIIDFMFDCFMILIVMLGFFGSLGAWEAESIGFGRLIVQLALSSGLIYAVVQTKANLKHLLASKRHRPSAHKLHPAPYIKRTA